MDDPNAGNDERFLLKDLFNRESVGAIGKAVGLASPEFDAGEFMSRIFDDRWRERELKQRMRHISTVLHGLLPGPYREQLAALLRAAEHTPRGFAALVFSDFVEAFGVHDWEASVPALARFTRLESAEFAIRPFLAADLERGMAQMLEWAQDPDPAVRRLASEGSRPRLPWGSRLHALVADPAPILPILERLLFDVDESVRRSVANNLNDISKDHPDLVVEWLAQWNPQPGTDLYRLARHALRTVLKRGHPGALAILGLAAEPDVELRELRLEPATPHIGGSAILSFTIGSSATKPITVLPGYAIHYVKADGSTSPKVFRLSAVVIQPGRSAPFRRTLSFRQMTTRVHRPGTHKVEILANGNPIGEAEFELAPPP